MDLGIDGKVALVCGASGGLGGAIVRALASEGVSVGAAGRDQTVLQDVASQTQRETGSTVVPSAIDFSDLSTINRAVDQVESQLGQISILVNMTGGPPPSQVNGLDTGAWKEQFDAMVAGVIALTDRVLPQMQAQKWGRIVTSTSSGAIAPIASLGVSNTLRSALHGWSKSLANEVAADGVTSNVVVPGRIYTRRIQALDEAKAQREGCSVDEVRSASTAMIPVGRYGDPAEYAAVVAFLASKPASYVTGSVVRVDGGLISGV